MGKTHLFTVEGRGRFPFDMLRYDACWPYTEVHDSYALELFEISDRRATRRIVLQSCKVSAPTEGRWESFGWKVVACDREVR